MGGKRDRVTSKLTQEQAGWIAMRPWHLAPGDAGRTMGAGGRRARQIRTEYGRTGRVLVLGRPGRRRKGASPGVVRRVLRARRKYRVGATAIRAILAIPGLSHHMAHGILEERGMVNRDGGRAKRVPWVRHGREYSNSL